MSRRPLTTADALATSTDQLAWLAAADLAEEAGDLFTAGLWRNRVACWPMLLLAWSDALLGFSVRQQFIVGGSVLLLFPMQVAGSSGVATTQTVRLFGCRSKDNIVYLREYRWALRLMWGVEYQQRRIFEVADAAYRWATFSEEAP